MFGFLNRWNDTMGTPLEQEPAWLRALVERFAEGRLRLLSEARTLRIRLDSYCPVGRESSIQGRGAFAAGPIVAGQVVAIKGGHVVDRATLEALPEKLQNSEIGIAKGLHLVALSESEHEDVMLFLNHSCEPNVGVRGNVAFVAMRDIQPGEELTIDYAMIDDHEDESMTCRCGTASCRGVIRGRDFRLPELRHRYGRFLSAYLLDELDAESPPL